MRKFAATFVLMLVETISTCCQKNEQFTISDPARNRLFVMSTGQIIPRGKFAISDYEIIVLGLGYAPTDFLQFNFVMFPPWFLLSRGGDEAFWIAGTKVQLIPPSNLFQGVSLGVDYIYNSLAPNTGAHPAGDIFTGSSTAERWISANVAGSIGTQSVKGHVNFAHIWRTQTETTSYVQVGAEFCFSSVTNNEGSKVMAETWFASDGNESIQLSTLILGVRKFSDDLTIEIGWPFYRNEEKPLRAYPIPYASINIFI